MAAAFTTIQLYIVRQLATTVTIELCYELYLRSVKRFVSISNYIQIILIYFI